VTCDREQVTALVDEALGPAARSAVEAHVAGCEECRAQLADERALRARLREIPAPELPFGLEQRVRRQVGRHRWTSRLTRVGLPLAAALLLALWARGYAPFVAWELSRDHAHCFGMETLPTEVLESEPERLAAWYGERGDELPLLPAQVGDVSLVGGRYCALPDVSFAPHVYYTSYDEQVSVFVVPHDVRMPDDYRRRVRGNAVALVRVGGAVVGVVSDDEQVVGSFVSRLRTSVAALEEARRRPPALVFPAS
jgi:hypothetical protein